jgi:hypothetical protein
MDDSIMRRNGLEPVLDELTQLDAAALATARRGGGQRELFELSERLLGLHARFAAEYRALLARAS